MHTVHLRINDSNTKLPTPVRLRVTGPNGDYFAPLGRLAHFTCGTGEDVGGNLRIDRESWCIIDGACEIALPAGVPLRIRATKGLEFQALDETLTLGPGQMAVRLPISRWCNWAERGWHTADGRAHFLSPHAALLEAAAEDVQIVNLLAKSQYVLAQDGNSYPTFSNLMAFSGQSPALEKDDRTVVVNTLNAHAVLGSLALLNSHRPVFPFAFGEPYDTDDWSLLDWCNQCHRKKGLAVWVDAFRSESLLGGEALLAAILGKLDAIEFDAQPRTRPLLPICYWLWNAGVRLPLMGSSGKESNRTPLGAMRTYTKLSGTERSYSAWVEAVRSGQTFITNGPLLKFEVAEQVRASAECAMAFERLELIADGRVIATGKPVANEGHWSASVEALCPADARWVAARAVGGPSPLAGSSVNFAHTSPVFLGPIQRDEAAAEKFLPSIEQVRSWAAETAHYRDSKWQVQLLESCNEAARLLRLA